MSLALYSPRVRSSEVLGVSQRPKDLELRLRLNTPPDGAHGRVGARHPEDLRSVCNSLIDGKKLGQPLKHPTARTPWRVTKAPPARLGPGEAHGLLVWQLGVFCPQHD